MDWQDEYYAEKMERNQKIEEAFELVTSGLTKQEIGELAQELMDYVESCTPLRLWED
jgi:hypothetical protein